MTVESVEIIVSNYANFVGIHNLIEKVDFYRVGLNH